MLLRCFIPKTKSRIGTKTIQILIEGNYNGYFKPDIHYIPLKKDLSNFDEAIEKFNDQNFLVHEKNGYKILWKKEILLQNPFLQKNIALEKLNLKKGREVIKEEKNLINFLNQR